MKKKLHVIPHAHWDREWYMPFEHHRYRLVELYDKLLETFKNDNDFKYYHTDGQVIPIYDYLEIRPEKRKIIEKLIKEDKIQTGPWYVLQDEYLTSGESQIRNLELGIKLTKELKGEPVMTGYFPDAFGNVSQAPQILNKFNIQTACFGRGLNEVGFDNVVVEQKGINKSELIWKSPDGSEVVSVLFANWYCNANDLPSDPVEIKKRFETIISRATPFSQIDDLLAMNGCDHTPLQSNLSDILKKAAPQFTDIDIIHSNFRDYLKVVEENKNKYSTVEGEISGQLTTGYNLLLNTASTRIDIKKYNHKNENKMLHSAESLSSTTHFLKLKDEYPSDYFTYFWKLFLQNHPHDSACSCNVDEVNSEILQRHKKAYHVSEVITSEKLDILSKNIKNNSNNDILTIYNKNVNNKDLLVKAYIDVDMNLNSKSLYLKDFEGNKYEVSHKLINNYFTYTLPKDRFRKVKYVDRHLVEFVAKDVPGLGFKSYKIILSDKENKNMKNFKDLKLENDDIIIDFNSNGSFKISNKSNDISFDNQNYFEYTLDIGNEYNYEQSVDNYILTTLNENPKIKKIISNNVKEVVEVKYELNVPEGILNKKASPNLNKLEIISTITLYKNLKYPLINTQINNKSKNFRIRAMFDTNIKSDVCYAHGQFDLVKRDIFPWEGWTNPSNCQRMDGFVSYIDDTKGLALSGQGIYEYEVIRESAEKTIAITILKGIDQLGDWGVFPTPDSQMIGKIDLDYIVYPFDIKHKSLAYNDILAYYKGLPEFSQTPKNNIGKVNANTKLFDISNNNIILSAFKKSNTDKDLLLRVYSISETIENVEIEISPKFKKCMIVNLAQDFIKDLEIINNKVKVMFKPKEIITLKLGI